MMNKSRLAASAFLIVALIWVLGVSRHMRAQDSNTPPSMAPVDQYLMDRAAEIALARSAAPETISRDATILVLGRHGYETAAEGKNGFVCDVERSWHSPFGNPNFWSPKIRAAVCYNPAAARSILPILKKKSEWALAGLSETQISDELKAAYAKKAFPALEPGAMSYMMSKGAWLDGGGNMAHLMFYALPDAQWGGNLAGSPVIAAPMKPPDGFALFYVPTGKWSDGTPAPLPK